MANHPESEYDAVIIGAGHNAIVTGVYLARAGWKVLIVERNKVPGGAVRTAEADWTVIGRLQVILVLCTHSQVCVRIAGVAHAYRKARG